MYAQIATLISVYRHVYTFNFCPFMLTSYMDCYYNIGVIFLKTGQHGNTEGKLLEYNFF